MSKKWTAEYKQEYMKQWRIKNIEKCTIYNREWKKNNPDKVNKNTGNWNVSNPEKYIISAIKSRAKKQGISFDIDVTDINIPPKCPILNIPIVREYKGAKNSGPRSMSPSLDRLDNTKGYVKGNVHIISNKANTMKSSATPEELINFALWVFATHGKDIYEIRKVS
jgi:hypothetical protein